MPLSAAKRWQMKRFAVLLAILLAALAVPAHAAGPDPVDMVNPFIGTTYGGDTFPGPDYPFGMIQWGPDTASQPSGGSRMRPAILASLVRSLRPESGTAKECAGLGPGTASGFGVSL